MSPTEVQNSPHIVYEWLWRALKLWQRIGNAVERRLRARLQRVATHQRKHALDSGIMFSGQPVIAPETKIWNQALAQIGKQACTLVDVGARWGAESSWWDLGDLVKYVGFEPDAKECERLNQLSGGEAKYVPYGLGAIRGQVPLYITQAPASSSLYPPDQELVTRFPQLVAHRLVREEHVSVTRLDDWWESQGRPWVGFIKIDTQGSELDILRGGTQALRGALGVEVEVEFSPLYVSQPLFSDVDSFLRSQGFSLWTLHGSCSYSERPWDPKPWHSTRLRPAASGRLYWSNAIYFRDYADHERWRNPSDSMEAHQKKLWMLASLLEASGDLPAAESCLKRIR